VSIKNRMERILVGNAEGQTLLQKILNGRADPGARPEDQLYNPLHLAINDMVELTFEDAGTYDVARIAAYLTRLQGKRYASARYFLFDSAAFEDAEPLVLELMQAEHGQTLEKYLFRIIEELEYDDEFLELLEDDIFIVTEETDEEEIDRKYEKSYHVTAQVQVLDEDGELRSGEVETWNYEMQDDLQPLYLCVEMDAADGWITIYEGRKLLDRELEIYRLSAP
jgi:hypothetical protein